MFTVNRYLQNGHSTVSTCQSLLAGLYSLAVGAGPTVLALLPAAAGADDTKWWARCCWLMGAVASGGGVEGWDGRAQVYQKGVAAGCADGGVRMLGCEGCLLLQVHSRPVHLGCSIISEVVADGDATVAEKNCVVATGGTVAGVVAVAAAVVVVVVVEMLLRCVACCAVDST